MNDSASKFLTFLGSLPLSKKISMAFVLILVIAGFALMFIWANQIDYQVLYNNLSPEDAGAIISELKNRRIPYKVEANGTVIRVPADSVCELRLALASEGLPNGGNVGFEIFDHLDFRTTKFVQELNYQRALQGELARTINNFKEVRSSRVFIVLPKASLFVEDRKPASASIQLDVQSSLPPDKLTAIVHLVASAVEGLEPEQVTVVDTKGTVIFKGAHSGSTDALLSNAQLDYKKKVESQIRANVQSMLEGIVGPGKAIVRVHAEIDFNKISLSEEEYDPLTAVLRSKRNIVESTVTGEGGVNTGQTLIDKRRGVLPPSNDTQRSHRKEDVTTNYEINKITKTTLRPAGNIQRLSVAAVIDGSYKEEKLKDGTVKRDYIPRSQDELKKFEELVKRAMGYNEDREDQVSVSSIPFSESTSIPIGTEPKEKGIASHILPLMGTCRTLLVNLALVAAVFFFIVRPLIKGLKKASKETLFERKELPGTPKEYAQIGESRETSQKERVIELARSNPGKTQQLIKGWIGEHE